MVALITVTCIWIFFILLNPNIYEIVFMYMYYIMIHNMYCCTVDFFFWVAKWIFKSCKEWLTLDRKLFNVSLFGEATEEQW